MKRLLLLPLLAGCLEVPRGAGQECASTDECDTANGEVCVEGLCYGNPPPGQYAVTVSAPVERGDLISTEIPTIQLPADGQLPDMALEAPVKFSGRVEAYCAGGATSTCSTASIAAEIRITRPSRFPGGPTLRFSTQSTAGVARGADSFTILVPRTHDGDPPYTVTIEGDGGGDQPAAHGGTDPAEVVPPRRITLVANDNLEHKTYTLGGANSPILSGVLKDGLGNYLTNYRVVALGHWDADSAKTEVSTVDYVTNGQYQITLAEGLVGPVEIVARSYDQNVVAPELHITGVTATNQQRTLSQPTGLGSRVDLAVPIKGLSGDGQVKPVAGARVIVSGQQDAAFSGAPAIVFTAEAITGDDGIAHLSLLDGATLAASYRLRVVPPASSNLGIVYGLPIALDAPPTVQLPSRIGLRGRVVDIHGNPLADVSVTARRSLQFLWSLATPDQSFLDEIPVATTITPESGDFVVWVDPALADAWAIYDLTFKTPQGSGAPSWVVPDFEIPRIPNQTTVPLADIVIPDAAYLRGKVVDPAGNPVEGSAVRIFQLPTDNSLCTEASHAPEGCTVEAQVLGDGESDDHGIVRLDLARP